MTHFKLLHTVILPHSGDCYLLGVLPDGAIYVEEVYEDGLAIAQHHLDAAGNVLVSRLDATAAYPLPDACQVPQHPKQHALNLTGLRQRGLREADRIASWVQPLTIMEKMPLLQHLGLTIPPLLLLGISESYVLAEAHISETVAVVVRRLRVAVALSAPQTDADGLPYDYETVVLHIAHTYDRQTATAPPLTECLGHFMDVPLQQPTDCLYDGKRLLITDAAETNRVLVYS